MKNRMPLFTDVLPVDIPDEKPTSITEKKEQDQKNSLKINQKLQELTSRHYQEFSENPNFSHEI
jgi:hypothetical protein